ncbi:hypothetical protein RRF57_006873 [Xylaria bambusicola]|uniref:Uncharacterized protein n=1 Tax=Xylaria bambusicola TaxID=326684 RepID=A0AAN7UR19_9PEZI
MLQEPSLASPTNFHFELPSSALQWTVNLLLFLTQLARIQQAKSFPPRRGGRVKERLLSERGDTRSVSRVATTVVPACIMNSDSEPGSPRQLHRNFADSTHLLRVSSPVIPQSTRSRRPFEPELDIDIGLIHMVQVIQNGVALRTVQSYNPIRHRAVDPERFPACSRMNTDERVNALDMLRTGLRVVAVKIGMRGPVYSVFAVDDLAEAWRQLLVCSVAARPERVAADGWNCIIV